MLIAANAGLALLNALPAHDAQAELLKCCGSKRWSEQMEAQRAFGGVNDLIESSERIWWSLKPDDWLEAFRSHPKIGERKAAADETSAASLGWSSKEQSGLAAATMDTKQLLTDLNRDYEAKFGFIYIICATGKSSEELLTTLQQRLQNDRETELQTAAAEQAKITRLRLHKLIETLERA